MFKQRRADKHASLDGFSTPAPMPVNAATSSRETVYYATVASNFARAFDKYTGRYDKAALPESTFADRFFVLGRHELAIGLSKAARLLEKLGLPGDRVLVLEAQVGPGILQPNVATGRGRVLPGSSLPLSGVHWVDADGQLEATCVEEVTAHSLACLAGQLQPYAALAPRTLSVLPIARACQAACRFCFSESSASLEQRARLADVALAERWMAPARAAGAERFVITGGGEPGLLAHESLVALMAAGRRHFPKTVLITNGVHLARAGAAERQAMLADYARAGLSVLSVSRHHQDGATNAAIMGIDTGTESVLAAWRGLSLDAKPRLRLVCVLQQGGVATEQDIAAYLHWAAQEGVDEVCFKELYVSTTLESAYHARPENAWSRAHQVPLSRLTGALGQLGFAPDGALPWGAPLYARQVTGPGGAQRTLRVAAYTEPSLYWERRHGIARSWNLMADGTCLASLEDPASQLALPGAAGDAPVPARSRVIPIVAEPAHDGVRP